MPPELLCSFSGRATLGFFGGRYLEIACRVTLLGLINRHHSEADELFTKDFLIFAVFTTHRSLLDGLDITQNTQSGCTNLTSGLQHLS